MKAHSWLEALLTWLSAVAVAVTGFCLIFFLGTFYDPLTRWLDSLFPIGLGMLFITIQLYIHRTGVFDVLFFSIYRVFESWRPGMEKRYEDAYDYKQAQGEKRARNKPYTLPFLVVASVLLIASLVLLCFEQH